MRTLHSRRSGLLSVILILGLVGSGGWGIVAGDPIPDDKTFTHISGMQFPPKIGNWERFVLEADDDPNGSSNVAYGYKESPAIARVKIQPVSKRTLEAEVERILKTLPKEIFREVKVVDRGEYVVRQGDHSHTGRFVRFTYTEADDKQRTEMSFYVFSVGSWLITFKHRFPESVGTVERERTTQFMESVTLPKS